MYLPLILERFGEYQTHRLDAVIVSSVPPFGFLVLESVGLTESSPNTSSSINILRSEIRCHWFPMPRFEAKGCSHVRTVYKQGSEDYLVWHFFATYLDNHCAYLHTELVAQRRRATITLGDDGVRYARIERKDKFPSLSTSTPQSPLLPSLFIHSSSTTFRVHFIHLKTKGIKTKINK